MFDSLISAGANLIGGWLNRDSNEDIAAANRAAQAEYNRQQIEQAEKNRAMQIQFAKEGVRWKVDDARAAGVHPLYALGANTVSYSPVSLGGGAYQQPQDNSFGNALARAGQDISRAVGSTRTASERTEAASAQITQLSLERAGLENELLRSKIAREKQSLNPPLPEIAKTTFKAAEEDEAQERPQLGQFGYKWKTDEGAANAEEWEKRYGDVAENVAGAINFMQDARANLPMMNNKREKEVREYLDRAIEWLKRQRLFY